MIRCPHFYETDPGNDVDEFDEETFAEEDEMESSEDDDE